MPEKDTEIMTQYDDYSVEELRKALDTIMLYSELNDSDVAEMESILAVLRKKAPFPHPHTAEEMWAEFQADHAEELAALGIRRNRDTEEVIEKDPEECADADAAFVVPIASAEKVQTVSAGAEPMHGKRGQTLIHTALIAAAVVAVMVIVTVSAAAAGINIWGWVPVWNDSTLQFVPETTPGIAVDIPSALKQLGIEDPLFPTWLPDGFILLEQQIRLEEPITLCAAYVLQDRAIIINIRYVSDVIPSLSTEKDNLDPIFYTVDNKEHLIFTNKNQTVASWKSEDCVVTISGDISIDDMKAIIDSIYYPR